ncbi:hypothetical protein [uncultured Mediterranean phage uvMED]|nr:hypothetical protein [uncultured Mediterranean phage uvMED]
MKTIKERPLASQEWHLDYKTNTLKDSDNNIICYFGEWRGSTEQLELLIHAPKMYRVIGSLWRAKNLIKDSLLKDIVIEIYQEIQSLFKGAK